ncbi:uncharacterized protein LOC131604280 [Vicia villosa]|uniref:uncharacterized protein LOC131604280 n=1 Tax=Vicia villosa TaxID=3911 RepID=UPI00273CDA9C|nr:uncharacterized protein LOC131604280 [Vicia villosa]
MIILIKQITTLKTKTQSDRKLWVDVLSENRNPSKGLTIQYVAPSLVDGEVEIEIEEDDVQSEILFWENALILYALGENFSMNMIKNFMVKTWNFVKIPNMYYNDEGYFILRFHSHEDLDAVLMRGPYTMRNVPLLIQEWRADFNLKRDMLRTLPIWIKLPQLPLYLWEAKSLSKIGSAIGVPLVTDECTASKHRVSYAKILVEVDITKEMVKEIAIKDNEGRKFTQFVEYEWRPLFCDKCKKLGHQCKEPLKKVERVWQPKPKEPIMEDQMKEGNNITEEVATPKTPTVQHSEDSKEHEGDNWTKVTSSRDRGKKILFAGTTNVVNCINGFEALGISKDSLVPSDGDPC